MVGDDPGVEEAVLLRELRAERERDLDVTGLDFLQHGAEEGHRALLRESSRACAARSPDPQD